MVNVCWSSICNVIFITVKWVNSLFYTSSGNTDHNKWNTISNHIWFLWKKNVMCVYVYKTYHDNKINYLIMVFLRFVTYHRRGNHREFHTLIVKICRFYPYLCDINLDILLGCYTILYLSCDHKQWHHKKAFCRNLRFDKIKKSSNDVLYFLCKFNNLNLFHWNLSIDTKWNLKNTMSFFRLFLAPNIYFSFMCSYSFHKVHLSTTVYL